MARRRRNLLMIDSTKIKSLEFTDGLSVFREIAGFREGSVPGIGWLRRRVWPKWHLSPGVVRYLSYDKPENLLDSVLNAAIHTFKSPFTATMLPSIASFITRSNKFDH